MWNEIASGSFYDMNAKHPGQVVPLESPGRGLSNGGRASFWVEGTATLRARKVRQNASIPAKIGTKMAHQEQCPYKRIIAKSPPSLAPNALKLISPRVHGTGFPTACFLLPDVAPRRKMRMRKFKESRLCLEYRIHHQFLLVCQGKCP